MLQQILKERFAVKAHYEDIEQSVYALALAKGVSPLDRYRSEASASASTNVSRRGPGHIRLQNATMNSFAGLLSNFLDRPVLDKTELTGHYDLTLNWAPERVARQSGSRFSWWRSTPPNSLPLIFIAIQDQLGLKLLPTKAAIRCLVIDHIELPSVN